MQWLCSNNFDAITCLLHYFLYFCGGHIFYINPPIPFPMLVSYVEYIFVFTLVFISVMTYYNWRNTKSVLFLLSFFVIFLFEHLLLAYNIYGTDRKVYPVLFYNFSPLYFIKAPLYYFFVRSFIQKHFKFKWYDLLHLIPFAFKLIDIIPYYLSPYSHKLHSAYLMLEDYRNFSNLELFTFFPQNYDIIFRNIQLVIYLAFCLNFIFSSVVVSSINEIRSEALKHIKSWLLVLTFLLLFVTLINVVFNVLFALNLSDIIYSNSVVDGVYHLGVFVYFALPFIFITFPKIVYGVAVSSFYFRDSTPKTKQVNSISNVDLVFNWRQLLDDKCVEQVDSFSAEDIISLRDTSFKIFNYLDSEEAFLNKNFQMVDLSNSLDIPKHKIQFCLNNFLHIKFADLKNEFRINYAIQILKKDTNLSLDGVCAKCGFASTSNFYTIFKQKTNMTPAQWIKENKNQ